MFLHKVTERNKALLETAFQLHQRNEILPDTYLIDMDAIRSNAMQILKEADKQNIELYFMLKQLGRNPYIAKELVKLGYKGAVVVDFKEAAIMMKYNIPISNVGHLVQAPKGMLKKLVAYGCHYHTVFSLEKIRDLNECAKAAGSIVPLLLKVVGEHDVIYSGQTAGFHLNELPALIKAVKKLDYVSIKGVTSFPCFLCDEATSAITPTPNLETLMQAKKILEQEGIKVENVNAPSTTSVETLRQMQGYGINSGEPGHGLSGTTPLHAFQTCAELPAVVYVSEVSHNFQGKAYCYGGGFYRRSHVKYAYSGTCFSNKKEVEVLPPDLDSIDYYFGLSEECNVNDTVIMAFRFQMFVTRSDVCIIEGIRSKQPKIVGRYTSLGELIHE